jgi:hypothetical protein
VLSTARHAVVVGKRFRAATVTASKSRKFRHPGLTLEADQDKWGRTLRANRRVAGRQGVQEKIFNSAHNRTQRWWSLIVERSGAPIVRRMRKETPPSVAARHRDVSRGGGSRSIVFIFKADRRDGIDLTVLRRAAAMLIRDLPDAWSSRSRLSSSGVQRLLLFFGKGLGPWQTTLRRLPEAGRADPIIDMACRLKLPCLAQQAFSLLAGGKLCRLVFCLFRLRVPLLFRGHSAGHG